MRTPHYAQLYQHGRQQGVTLLFVNLGFNPLDEGDMEQLRVALEHRVGSLFGRINLEIFEDPVSRQQWVALYPTAKGLAPTLCTRLVRELFQADDQFHVGWVDVLDHLATAEVQKKALARLRHLGLLV